MAVAKQFFQYTLGDCISAWRAGETLPVPADGVPQECEGDCNFAAGQFKQAALNYAQVARPNSICKAKQGWVAAILGDFERAKRLLTSRNCGASSAALALLALVEVGGHGAPLLNANSKAALTAGQRTKLSAKVSLLLQQALEGQAPDYLAFYVYQEIHPFHQDGNIHLEVAKRGFSLYPQAVLRVWHARLLRQSGGMSSAVLSDLEAHIPAEWDVEYVEEVFYSAFSIDDYLCLDRLIEVSRTRLRPGESGMDEAGSVQLDVLQSYLQLRRHRSGETSALDNACERLAPYVAAKLAALAGTPDSQSADAQIGCLTVLALRLALACEREEQGVIASLGEVLINARLEPVTGSVIDDVFSALYFNNPLCAVRLDLDLSSHSSLIESCVGEPVAKGWRFIRAAEQLALEEDTGESLKCVMALAPELESPGLFPTVCAAWLGHLTTDGVKSYAQSMIKYIRWAQRFECEVDLCAELSGSPVEVVDALASQVLEALQDDPELRGDCLIEFFASALVEHKRLAVLMALCERVLQQGVSSDALFYSGYILHVQEQWQEARARYEALITEDVTHVTGHRNLVLVYSHLGLLNELEALAHTVGLQAERDRGWSDALKIARSHLAALQSKQQQLEAQRRLLSLRQSFSSLLERRIDPEEITLAEAVYLVALMRGCDMDHVHSRLAPFGNTAKPLDPTSALRVALLGLLQKGILGISTTTPDSAFDVSEEQPGYHVHRITWTFNWATSALYQLLRELHHDQWPDRWRTQADFLARDLAVEECVAFLERLANERGIEMPVLTEVRSVYRLLLEKCSVSRCWYFSYLAAMSANDYRTKYNANSRAVTTRLIRLVDEKAARGLEKGYGSDFHRTASSPRSQLSEALHDVFTGWGEDAFVHVLPDLHLGAAR